MGLLAGGALVLGAAVARFVKVPSRLVAAIMAFGSGVLMVRDRPDDLISIDAAQAASMFAAGAGVLFLYGA